MAATPQHVNTHSRNDSEVTEVSQVSRFSNDSDKRSHSSTSTANNPSSKRLCSFKFMSKLKKSLLSWRKKDKNKEQVLPTVSVEVNVKEKEKEKKKRSCCIIILIIIILMLLGNMIALDALYLRSPILQTNNITTLLNGNASDTNSPNAPEKENIKSIVCVTLLATSTPKTFPCRFCADDQAFYNVTTFCALQSIWANAVNQTSLENLRWMQTSDFCDWGGISCDKDSKEIITLDLLFPNTPRTYDFNLGDLKTLQRLTISGDKRIPVGVIPPKVFQLENLVEFSITSTALTGPIPNTFDKMKSLKSLQFRDNNLLNVTIPDTLSTTSLTTLVYSGSNISGVIPDFIGNSKTLQSSLETLDLSLNRYTGKIPDSLMNLPKLKSFNLGGNLLSGEPFPLLTSAKFAKSLISFILSSNSFSGPIPASISQFVNLADIDFQKNTFTGPIPSEISSIKNLSSIFFNNNNLSGNIPNEIGNMRLDKLWLADNALTGVIPNSICKAYQTCSLARNQFSAVPVTCGSCLLV